jgi:hypothetical protein
MLVANVNDIANDWGTLRVDISHHNQMTDSMQPTWEQWTNSLKQAKTTSFQIPETLGPNERRTWNVPRYINVGNRQTWQW